MCLIYLLKELKQEQMAFKFDRRMTI